MKMLRKNNFGYVGVIIILCCFSAMISLFVILSSIGSYNPLESDTKKGTVIKIEYNIKNIIDGESIYTDDIYFSDGDIKSSQGMNLSSIQLYREGIYHFKINQFILGTYLIKVQNFVGVEYL